MVADTSLERLCRAILHALQSIRMSRKTDEAIRDGYMCFLLRRIGEALNVFVFGEDDEKWKSSSACVEAGIEPGPEQVETRQRNRTIHEAQVPYLIWLLEQSIVCFASESGSRFSKRLSGKASKNQPMKKQAPLSTKVKLRLQSTILKEVIGQDLADFVESLKEPEDPGISIEPWPAHKQVDIADFFKSEVWRLVGWDCLRDRLK
ncbi:MAG: hypothetical protein Q9174_006666 [Haloplaca sp. 1 TL-2023]